MKKFLSAAVAIAIIMNSVLCANVLSSNVCEAAQEDINMEYTYDMLRNREGNKVYTITLPADYGVDVETLSGTVSKKEGLTFWRAVKNILYTVFFVYFGGVATQILNEKYPKFNEYVKKNVEFFKSLSQLTKDKFTGVKGKILLLKK